MVSSSWSSFRARCHRQKLANVLSASWPISNSDCTSHTHTRALRAASSQCQFPIHVEVEITRIPRRRRRHRLRLAYILTSDTRDFLKLFLWQAERHADILATILARMSARMSVSVLWNAVYNVRKARYRHSPILVYACIPYSLSDGRSSAGITP